MTRFSKVHLAVVLPLMSGLLLYLGAPVPVQAAFGLVSALLAPGFLASVLVRRRYPGTVTEVALGLIGSVGMLIVLGVVLNLLPWGLTPATWSIALIALTLVLAVAVFRRPRSHPETEAARDADRPSSSSPRERRFAPVAAAVLACAALLITATLVTTSSQRDSVQAQRLTELSLSQKRGIPHIHITNAEGGPMTYRLVISAAGRPAQTMEVSLQDGEQWNRDLKAVPAKTARGDEPVLSVALFRADDRAPYREVHLNRAPL